MSAVSELGDMDNQQQTLTGKRLQIRAEADVTPGQQLPTVVMSVSSSSTTNYSSFLDFNCISYVSLATVVRGILSLPLSILVFYLGHQRWWRQRSFKTTSHSDIFTYHMSAMDLFWVFGCICFYCGTYANLPEMMMIGVHTSAGFFYGATLFHLLTCVERYLAVVHPIIYMKLKTVRGVWIRNISIGCAWLLCFGYMGISALYMPSYPIIPLLCYMVVSLIVVSFCGLSILCVLTRPGPGKGRDEKKQVDQTKQRAFHTIGAITGALWLWFGALLISIALDSSPLLYLHRAGKLSFCCYNNE